MHPSGKIVVTLLSRGVSVCSAAFIAGQATDVDSVALACRRYELPLALFFGVVSARYWVLAGLGGPVCLVFSYVVKRDILSWVLASL